ncbi:MAG: hypothetical protein AMXMBFR58_06140 [Phycisphaerae bacterium]
MVKVFGAILMLAISMFGCQSLVVQDGTGIDRTVEARATAENLVLRMKNAPSTTNEYATAKSRYEKLKDEVNPWLDGIASAVRRDRQLKVSAADFDNKFGSDLDQLAKDVILVPGVASGSGDVGTLLTWLSSAITAAEKLQQDAANRVADIVSEAKWKSFDVIHRDGRSSTDPPKK